LISSGDELWRAADKLAETPLCELVTASTGACLYGLP